MIGDRELDYLKSTGGDAPLLISHEDSVKQNLRNASQRIALVGSELAKLNDSKLAPFIGMLLAGMEELEQASLSFKEMSGGNVL